MEGSLTACLEETVAFVGGKVGQYRIGRRVMANCFVDLPYKCKLKENGE